ncbi:hypothetical protein CEXT_160441 [Caerostris extrusa]|uniref:Uncharacterized protein n=1 Tax=Caerostris extrusa TaxID=172846 RepID=A0AAV4PL78_CAEEX|nr:hypothetical protein CEXT_160441 [Caerostris extrusa]
MALKAQFVEVALHLRVSEYCQNYDELAPAWKGGGGMCHCRCGRKVYAGWIRCLPGGKKINGSSARSFTEQSTFLT